MKKELIKEEDPKYMVFAIEPDVMLQESLIQQSNSFDTIGEARKFADKFKGTCYVFQKLEQHYERPDLSGSDE